MQNQGLTRRAVLGGLVGGLGLAGCGTSPTLDLIGESITGVASNRADNYPLTVEQIRALPYASLGVRIGKNAPGVMILANYNGEDLNWASADRVILVTQNGRLVKTVGLSRDLSNTQWTSTDPLQDFTRSGGGVVQPYVNRFIDLRHDDDFGVPIESRLKLVRSERIIVLGQPRDTSLVSEVITARKWRWSAENLFWIEQATGTIIRSRQSFCPEVAALTLEVLKPAASQRA